MAINDTATKKQIDFIKTLYKRQHIEPTAMKMPGTVGEASKLIDELKEDVGWK